MTAMLYFLLFSFVSKNLTNYGKAPIYISRCDLETIKLGQTKTYEYYYQYLSKRFDMTVKCQFWDFGGYCVLLNIIIMCTV